MENHCHIYESVSGALLSRKTSHSLGILLPNYPEPLPEILDSAIAPGVQTIHSSCSSTSGHIRLISKKELMEFPAIFDGQIRTMYGEVSKIAFTEADKPFYVSTPWTLPYAYTKPPKNKVELLEL